MTIKLGINGFGRIGRLAFRIAWDDPDVQIVGINDITDAATLAHLLKYDSVHGIFDHTVSSIQTDSEMAIIVDGKQIPVFAAKDPSQIPWDVVGADIVAECTGLFTSRPKAALNQARKSDIRVILSAPAKEKTPEDKIDGTFVVGINCGSYDPAKHKIISNASCTTNCLAPMVKVILENFGLLHGYMTTIHSYTNDQRILDLPHKDLRRARAAAMSMIPTTTGAAKAVGLVLPEVAGKMDGISIRVPTPNVSCVDLVVELPKETTTDAVKAAFKAAANGSLKGILNYEEAPLVSIDYNHNPYSGTVDADYIKVIDKTMLKVLGWYDNEWGYANRLVDMIRIMGGLKRKSR